MRLAVLVALATCGGPTATPYTQQPAAPESRVMRPPANAPPDPLGTTRPGNRSCAENRDCKAGETCFAPDFVPSGGPAPQCQTDAQCQTGQLCAAGTCAAPCTETSCAPAHECRPDGRCAPLPCAAPRAPVCAQNFRCEASSGTCTRLPCTSRAQCDTGVCYQGRCFSRDAYCMPQTYCCKP